MERLENIYPVVKRLLGMTSPIGETTTDRVRLLNLQDTTELVYKLLSDIQYVADIHHNGEYSIIEAKEFAQEFLKSLKEIGV